MSQNNIQTKLLENIPRVYSLEELKTFCVKFNKVGFDSLPGTTIDEKVRELITFCERQYLISDLLLILIQERPKIDWFNIVKDWVNSVYDNSAEIQSINADLKIKLDEFIDDPKNTNSTQNLHDLLKDIEDKSHQKDQKERDRKLLFFVIISLLILILFSLLGSNISRFRSNNETGKENADTGIQATETIPQPLETSVPILTPEKTPVIFTPTLPTLINNAIITPTPIQVAYETATPAQTPIPTVQVTFVVTYSIIYLREGPGDNYKIIDQLLRGASGVVIEKYQNRDWWYFLKSDNGSQGWVSQFVVEFVEDTADTSIHIALTISPSPIPTQTYTPTHTPTSTETPDNDGGGNNGGQTPLPPPGPPIPPP